MSAAVLDGDRCYRRIESTTWFIGTKPTPIVIRLACGHVVRTNEERILVTLHSYGARPLKTPAGERRMEMCCEVCEAGIATAAALRPSAIAAAR